MSDDHLRSRIGVPLLMLLALLGGIGVLLFSLSRILLAISPTGAVVIALAVAGFVLLVASTLGQNPAVSGRALGVALAIGLLGVGGAGVAALQAGPREIEPHGAEAEAGSAQAQEDGDDGGGDGGEEIPEEALVWAAEDIEFTDAPDSAEAGEVTIAIDNQGGITHDVTIDELDLTVEAGGGETAVEEVEVEPGTYSYYCSVPGHESQMNGEITFE